MRVLLAANPAQLAEAMCSGARLKIGADYILYQHILSVVESDDHITLTLVDGSTRAVTKGEDPDGVAELLAEWLPVVHAEPRGVKL